VSATRRAALVLVATLVASAPAARGQSRTPEVVAAEHALARGDASDAKRRARIITNAYEQSGTRWSADDRVAAGRAYVILGASDDARMALKAFDAAIAADKSNVEARLRAGDLFLDKYNAPDAKASFDEVLAMDKGNARAMLGLGRVLAFEGKREGLTYARAAVAADPRLVEGHVFLAQGHLEAEAYDSAMVEARLAIAADSESMPAWGVFASAALLRGDSAEFRRARAAALKLNPRPANFYLDLADAAGRQRRYGDAVKLAREALAFDSTSVRALGMLGTHEMRAGNLEAARPLLERAFALDPFNLWHKNTLDLLDQMQNYVTLDRGHFHIVAPPDDARELTPYLLPLLEEAYDTLSKRYHYAPSGRVRVEIYSRHADFSVRTLGLTGLGALGVSFGPVLVIDSPTARDIKEFNWGSTAWHELAHTFTLGLSNNHAPRWFSEGLSVLEERRARPEWGADASVEFLAVYLGGKILPVSRLNDGFVRPRYGAETIFSYYDASLVCEMIEQEFGANAIVEMLKAYRDGLSTPDVFARVLKMTPAQMDAHYDAWFRTRFATPLRHVAANDGEGPVGGEFVNSVRKAMDLLSRNQVDSARSLLQLAQGMFPTYAGPDAPALMLAKLAQDRSDVRGTLAEVQRVTQRNETAWDANLLEADLRLQLGDSTGALIPLQRLIWIWPYDESVHVRIAELASRTGNRALAVRERRAVVSLNPTDMLEARYQLARALAEAGDVAAARTELLGVLESAPSFEKAQSLLLELKTRRATPQVHEESA
jgi:cellulose synthase operon protein C